MPPIRIAVLCAAALVAACTTTEPVETAGTPKKPGLTERIGLGSTLGAILGSDAGRGLDERDRSLSADAEYDALQYGAAGAAKEWKNTLSGHSGIVTPGPAYSVNQYTCRDYTHRIVVGPKEEVVRSTACRQPDGSWRPLG
ncbi:RT0821/Lpp0805 family surface protein [Prosthecomicrobium sp. N25]|uniref:RT0821/Lpp0805 family surface protein n=1 Tax=Prosthecomicrobium sp. N25 TaxID=3129254 RepID=UPI003077F270